MALRSDATIGGEGGGTSRALCVNAPEVCTFARQTRRGRPAVYANAFWNAQII